MKKKISLYLTDAQLRLIDQIAKSLHQKRALILREAVNVYLSFYLRAQKDKR